MTHTGRTINFATFCPDDVDIEEVAHSLGLLCRFGGHCREFYPVAQHAVLVALFLEEQGHPPEIVFTGLHHDDTEAYLGDVISPLKKILPGYVELEHRFATVISKKLDLIYPFPEVVHMADREILQRENDNVRWLRPKHPAIEPWNAYEAEKEYLRHHRRLLRRIKNVR